MSVEKSALRLAALNAPAAALGLGAGLSLADARARYPALVVEPHDPEADQRLLEDLAEACARYTPLVALDGPDGLILDMSGCAHLFGGEAGLARDLLARVAGVGLSARAAIVATPGGAAALARFGGRRSLIVPEGTELGPLLAPLPLAALRLAPALLASLARLGLARIGDLLDKPRAPLAARFGADMMDRLDGALVSGRAALTYRFPPPRFSVDKALAEPVERVEDVLGLARHLAGSLAGLMERHGLGARRLDLALFRVDGKVTRLHVGTGRPLRDPALVQRLFAEKVAQLSSLDAGFGFDLIRLSAPLAEPMDARQDGFDAQREAEEAVDRLLDRLAARFGRGQVLVPACADAHMPEAAGRLVPAQDYARQAGAARAFRAPPVPAEPAPAAERAAPSAAGEGAEQGAEQGAGTGQGRLQAAGRLRGALQGAQHARPENIPPAPAVPPPSERAGTASPFSLRPPFEPAEAASSVASRASLSGRVGNEGAPVIAPSFPDLQAGLTGCPEEVAFASAVPSPSEQAGAASPPALRLPPGPGERSSPLAATAGLPGASHREGTRVIAPSFPDLQAGLTGCPEEVASAPAVPSPSGPGEGASPLASGRVQESPKGDPSAAGEWGRALPVWLGETPPAVPPSSGREGAASPFAFCSPSNREETPSPLAAGLAGQAQACAQGRAQGRAEATGAPSAAREGAVQGALQGGGQGGGQGALPVCSEKTLSALAVPSPPSRAGTLSPFFLHPSSGPGEVPSPLAFTPLSGSGEAASPLAAGRFGREQESPKGGPSAAGEGAVHPRLENSPSAPAVTPPSGREERASPLASSAGPRPPTSNGRASSAPPRGGAHAAAARAEGPPDGSRADLAGPARPLRLLDYPEPAEAVAEVPDGPPLRFRWRRVTHLVLRAEGPERIAAPWWREDGLSPTRDYFRVETVEGHRFWLFRAGLYGTGPHLPAWYVHGQFG